jgi:glycosyltransferase involved in cell wall biosynthesis
MTKPIVSILTLTYNHEKFIAECIQSVQNQSFTDWELLIVDDGSTDKTVEIIQEFYKIDSRIKIFSRENIGVFRMKENYNFALSHAKGKYIAILDGDDIWLPEKLSLQIPLLESHQNAVIIFGQSYRSNENMSENLSLDPSEKNGFLYKGNNYFTEIKNLTQHIIFGNIIPSLTAVIRREKLEEIGNFIQSHDLPLIDLPTWLELSLHGSGIFIKKPLGKWRHHGNEVSLIHAVQMGKMLCQFSIDFYEQHKDNLNLATVNSKKISKTYNQYNVIRYARSARYHLANKNFTLAKEEYLMALFNFGWKYPIWKLRAFVGLIFTFLKLDLEKFVKFIGRNSYK